MKRLTTSLCLILLVFLGSTGESVALPQCPGSYNQYAWDNCFGTHIYPRRGGKYVGEWRNDKRHGQGTYTFTSGSKYVGEWRNEKPHGQGTYFYADGRVEEGIWENHSFILSGTSATDGWSADFDKGVDAYEKRDYATALRELGPFAKQGNADAQFYLGFMYISNRKCELIMEVHKGEVFSVENPWHTPACTAEQGFKWYTLAAEQGHALAQYNLGLIYDPEYDRGQRCDSLDHYSFITEREWDQKNCKTAIKWYTRAAEQGYAPAQNNLGLKYGCVLIENLLLYELRRFGYCDVPKDCKTAFKWFSLAAEQGHAGAQYNLGLMYYNVEGVIQDHVYPHMYDVYAHMWWNIAASQGHEGAAKYRDIIAERMTPADISAAQNIARECVKKNYKDC